MTTLYRTAIVGPAVLEALGNVVALLGATRDAIDAAKPGDRSWLDRRVAILATDAEKLAVLARDTLGIASGKVGPDGD